MVLWDGEMTDEVFYVRIANNVSAVTDGTVRVPACRPEPLVDFTGPM